MNKILTGLVIVGGLASCTMEADAKWTYVCDSGQIMTWEFNSGQKGTYSLEGGSVLKPKNSDPSDRVFLRQDGAIFYVTGTSDVWNIKNTQRNSVSTCKRKV